MVDNGFEKNNVECVNNKNKIAVITLLVLLFFVILYFISGCFANHNKYFDIVKKVELNNCRAYSVLTETQSGDIVISQGNDYDVSGLIELYSPKTNEIKTIYNIYSDNKDYSQRANRINVFPIRNDEFLIFLEDKVSVYDYKTKEYKEYKNIKINPQQFSVKLKDENILLIDNRNPKITVPNIQLLNTKNMKLEKVGAFPFPLSGFKIYQNKNGELYIFGGVTNDISAKSKSPFAFQPSNNKIVKYNPQRKNFEIVGNCKHGELLAKASSRAIKIDDDNVLIETRYVGSDCKELFVIKLNLKTFEVTEIYKSLRESSEIYYFSKFVSGNILYMFDLVHAKLKLIDINTGKSKVLNLNKDFKGDSLTTYPLGNNKYILIVGHDSKSGKKGKLFIMTTKLKELK